MQNAFNVIALGDFDIYHQEDSILTTTNMSMEPFMMKSSDGPKPVLSDVTVGSTLQSTTIGAIATSANCSRSCAIEIRNFHQDIELRDPAHFIVSGLNQNPPPPVIKPGYAEACLFRKSYNSVRGSVGVLVYKIDKVVQDDKKSEIINRIHDNDNLVLMWHIPFMGVSLHAVGIKKNATADLELFKQMHLGCDSFFKRQPSGVCSNYETTISGIDVKVTGSLSDPGTASWIVSIQ